MMMNVPVFMLAPVWQFLMVSASLVERFVKSVFKANGKICGAIFLMVNCLFFFKSNLLLFGWV